MLNLAEDFLFCGSSALFLLIANLFPGYWYFSFIALLPFLWRIRKASPQIGLRLGLLLGLTFWTFSSFDSILISFWATSTKIICGTLLFALWGWLVGLARIRLGFNPVIVAGLWVFFELVLVKLGYTSCLLIRSVPTTGFLHSITALFGVGLISFIVILLNSLLLAAAEYTIRVLSRGEGVYPGSELLNEIDYNLDLITLRLLRVPQMRAPPMQSRTYNLERFQSKS